MAEPVPGPDPLGDGPASRPAATRPAASPTSQPATPEAKGAPVPQQARGRAQKNATANEADKSKSKSKTELPAAPNPQRELRSSEKIRREVQGATPETPAPAPPPPKSLGTTKKEMEELRRFEKSVFPRPGQPSRAREERSARPGAQSPPPELRSSPHTTRRAPAPKRPPARWLSRLALPRDLPVRWDARLIRYLEYYRDNPRGRAVMSSWLRRMGRYQGLITRILEKHRVPRSLIYVAMIESGFNPRLTSRAGAAGLWQFMTRSGRGYGLERDYWIDERRNPKLSTEAGARYLKDLHQRFGSWELALAAYNAGYFAVQRSIKKYNTNDYWQLCRYESGLPWSTTLYVPKVLASAIVALNRNYFGYSHVRPEPELRHDLVSVPTSITLAQAARAAGVTRDEVALLNPELRRGRTPPSSKAWLRIPRGNKRAFYANLARMKGQLARHRPYVVRLGETAATLAASLGISKHRLRRINGMRRDTDLRPGLIILVPARRTRAAGPVADAADRDAADGKEHEKLLVAVPRGTPRAVRGRRRVFYRTVKDDRLPVIARYLGVGTDELRRWNRLDPTARLIPDMVLQAFVPRGRDLRRVALLDPERIQVMVAGSETFLDTYEERNGRKRVIYTARRGDTLRSVGRRFGLSVGSVARINRFSRTTKLKAGQRLVVYVNPAKLRARKRKRAAKKKKRLGRERRLRRRLRVAQRDDRRRRAATKRARPKKKRRRRARQSRRRGRAKTK